MIEWVSRMGIAFSETLFHMCSLCSCKKVTVRFAFSVQVSYLTWSVLPGIIGGDLNKCIIQISEVGFKCAFKEGLRL